VCGFSALGPEPINVEAVRESVHARAALMPVRKKIKKLQGMMAGIKLKSTL
jgi:hypothetical protein